MIDNAQKAKLAKMIVDTPFMLELFAELEEAAVNASVWAKPTDHETRAAAMSEVRTIRNLLTKLRAIAGEADRQGRPSPDAPPLPGKPN